MKTLLRLFFAAASAPPPQQRPPAGLHPRTDGGALSPCPRCHGPLAGTVYLDVLVCADCGEVVA